MVTIEHQGQQRRGMTGTERLNAFIKKSIEDEIKPRGMSSEFFWELCEILEEKEVG